jgi:hypothetical protein
LKYQRRIINEEEKYQNMMSFRRVINMRKIKRERCKNYGIEKCDIARGIIVDNFRKMDIFNLRFYMIEEQR